MPIYEYACQKVDCAKVTEILRPMREADNLPLCVICGGETKRKVSASSFSLKGGGWASDGYSGGT